MTEPAPAREMPALVLRPFQNADAPQVARLVTDSVRGHWTYGPEQFREPTDARRQRLVALRGEEVIATTSTGPFGESAPDALRLDLAGDQAAFTALYLAHLAELPAGFTRLLGVTREDFTGQMAFFHAAGFRNAWQSWGAHLNLAGFDFAPFQPLEERLFLAGIEIEQLSNDAPEADWAALHSLHLLGVRDAPRHPTTTPDVLTLDTLRREEVVFVARVRGVVVASTRLTPRPGPGGSPALGEVESEHTVTHPDWRARGVATALKARALAWARDAGYPHADTGGAVLNLPMLRVNARLGYVPEAMWVTWTRDLPTS